MYNRKWVKITAIVLAVLMAGSGLGVGIGGEAGGTGAEVIAPGGIVVEHVVHHKLHGDVADGPGIHHVGGKRRDAFGVAVINNGLQLLQSVGNGPAVFLKHGPVVIHALIHGVEHQALHLAVHGDVDGGGSRRL